MTGPRTDTSTDGAAGPGPVKPWFVLLVLAASIALAETLVMGALHVLLPGLDPLASVVVDAALLVVVLFPALWLLVVRPLANAARAERRTADRAAAVAADMQTLLDRTRDLIYRHDAAGVFTFVSPSVTDIAGYTADEWSKHYATFLTDNPLNRECVDLTERTLRTGEPSPPYRVEIRHKDGHPVLLEVRERPCFEGDRVVGIIGVAREMSDAARAEEAMKAANERLEAAVTELSQRGREAALLAEMGELLQASATPEEANEVVAGMIPRLIPHVPGAVLLYAPSRNLLETVAAWGGFSEDEAERVLRPDECWALRRGRVHLVGNGSGNPACAHVKSAPGGRAMCVPMAAHGEAIGLLTLRCRGADGMTHAQIESTRALAETVAERVGLAIGNLRLREDLRNLSIRDPLTQLFNRRYLEETLVRELRRAERAGRTVGIVMIDVDHFKRFNDTFGHAAGDALLRSLGALLRSSVRAGDVASRLGGEEFCLVLPEAPLEGSVRRAEAIREAAHALSIEHGGGRIGSVTISCGVASFPEHGGTGEDVLRAADEALYRAKRAGRDRVEAAGRASVPPASPND